jgi:hypothetical protein
MIDKAGSRLFSMILHPMILPSLAVIILYSIPGYVSFSTPMNARRIIIGLVFVNTCVAPFLLILLMKKLGIVTSTTLEDRVERFYPTLVTLFFYVFTFFLFRQANLPTLLIYFFAGASAIVAIAFIVNLFWKISFHMMSMGGFTGFLISLSLLLQLEMAHLIIAAVIASGILGTSRLKLEAHNPAQVYTGWITGFLVMMITMIVIRG